MQNVNKSAIPMQNFNNSGFFLICTCNNLLIKEHYTSFFYIFAKVYKQHNHGISPYGTPLTISSETMAAAQ
jgi:hypothetical protein